MKKINIVKENTDFDRIIKNNKPFRCHNFLLYIELSNGIHRFGISVSKKICNAVNRNKYKRQIKDIVDDNIYKENFNCIIIAKKGIKNLDYDMMKSELNYCFNKIGILEGETNEEK